MAWGSLFLDVLQCREIFMKILPGNMLMEKCMTFQLVESLLFISGDKSWAISSMKIVQGRIFHIPV